jgi:uncharacterized membrane protein
MIAMTIAFLMLVTIAFLMLVTIAFLMLVTIALMIAMTIAFLMHWRSWERVFLTAKRKTRREFLLDGFGIERAWLCRARRVSVKSL